MWRPYFVLLLYPRADQAARTVARRRATSERRCSDWRESSEAEERTCEAASCETKAIAHDLGFQANRLTTAFHVSAACKGVNRNSVSC